MNLNNELYTIIKVDEAAFTIRLNKDCFIYKAHFPERPITPGVCIIQIASELLSVYLGKSLQLISVANAKFLSVINPDEVSSLTYTFSKVSFSEENEKCKAAVVVSSSDKVFTKLSLEYNITQ